MRASGPVAIRTGTLIRKTGCRGPLGTAAARHVIRWNRKALLVEDLLHQVGGGLGECELAEARVDGGEVGVDDLVEGVVLHGASFRTPAWFLVFLSSSASCGASLLVVFFASFFCCAFTIGRKVCVCHAAIAISIVDSSVHLKERIKKRSYILLRSLPQRRFEQKSQRFSVDFNAGSPVCVVSSRRSAARLPVSTRTADFASF